MSEFMLQYDTDSDLITEAAPETSDEYFELALDADNDKDALKYEKKALSLDPHNFDAEAMVIELKAKNLTELVRNYEMGCSANRQVQIICNRA